MRKLRPTLHWRVRHEGGHGETEFIELDPGELSGLFAAPPWLRDLGVMAWLLVGVTALLAGTVWFLSLTQTIVTPVVTAAILASVLAPLVRVAQESPRAARGGRRDRPPAHRGGRRGVRRAGPQRHLGQSGDINSQLQSATDKLESTLKDSA